MTTDRRLERVRWYPRLILAALALAFVIAVASGSGADTVSGRLGGDYPAFYAAGDLAISDPDALYDVDAQAEAEADLFEEGADPGFLYFAYPPYVALAYSPLAQLPFRISYVVQTLLMGAALVGGLWVLRPLLPALDRRFEASVVAALVFYPMFVAVTAGQNTAVTFLLIALALRAMAAERDGWAGVALAALLYKPQFVALFFAVALLQRRWRLLGAGAAGAVALYLVGAAVQGFGWLGPWLEQARWFNEVDAEVNSANAISWLGVAESTWGVGSTVARAIGGTLALATVLLVLWIWWRYRDRLDLLKLGAITVPAVILASPHAMFYDAGLLVLPLLVLAEDWDRNRTGLIVVFALAFLHLPTSDAGYTILFPLTVAVFIWTVHQWVGIPPRVRETISLSPETGPAD